MPEMPEWGDVMTHHEDVNGAMSCETPAHRCKATLCKPAGSQNKFMTDGQIEMAQQSFLVHELYP